MLADVATTFRPGDVVYVDPLADDAPWRVRGQTAHVTSVEDDCVYVVFPDEPAQAAVAVPITAVRVERRRRKRPVHEGA